MSPVRRCLPLRAPNSASAAVTRAGFCLRASCSTTALGNTDPFVLPDAAWEDAVSTKLLGEEAVPLSQAISFLAA